MKKFRVRLTGAALLVALSMVGATPAHAQSGGTGVQSITLSPSNTNITVDPGITATRDLTLLNDGDVGYRANLSVAPYHVEGENYDPQFTRVPGTTDASEWVTLSASQVSLESHAQAVIPYTLTVPKATAPGGYYAVVLAEAASTSTTGVTTHNRVGDILYITVTGPVATSGTLLGLDIPKFVFGSTVPFGIKVSNGGGVHFQSQAKFTVKSILGNVAFQSDNTYYVLPQTTRHIEETWVPKAFFGIYEVSRTATVAGEQKSLPDSLIVVATPGIIPLIVFIVLLGGGLIVLLTTRRKAKKKHKTKHKTKA